VRWFTSRFGKRADRIEHRILEQLLSGLGEVRSLLDVGCGSGHFAALDLSQVTIPAGTTPVVICTDLVPCYRSAQSMSSSWNTCLGLGG
jgi:hypothetical protein